MSLVGLFGGSFDPIHHGHLIVAQVAAEALGLDQVRFMPANEQPFKAGRHAAPAGERAEMVRLAIAGMSGFALESRELERPGPSYTIDTLRGLTAEQPGHEFVLLVGADAAADIHLWREPDELVRLARVAVLARPGAAPIDGPAIWRTVPVPAIEISATAVRERVLAGRSVRYWVPAAVADHIARHRLYLSDV
ncbi:MAG: nicotinate-nucleotide adenylyltransferase [Gemmatimonadota bacterium]